MFCFTRGKAVLASFWQTRRRRSGQWTTKAKESPPRKKFNKITVATLRHRRVLGHVLPNLQVRALRTEAKVQTGRAAEAGLEVFRNQRSMSRSCGSYLWGRSGRTRDLPQRSGRPDGAVFLSALCFGGPSASALPFFTRCILEASGLHKGLSK